MNSLISPATRPPTH